MCDVLLYSVVFVRCHYDGISLTFTTHTLVSSIGGNFVQFAGPSLGQQALYTSGRLDCRRQSVSLEQGTLFRVGSEPICGQLNLEWCV